MGEESWVESELAGKGRVLLAATQVTTQPSMAGWGQNELSPISHFFRTSDYQFYNLKCILLYSPPAVCHMYMDVRDHQLPPHHLVLCDDPVALSPSQVGSGQTACVSCFRLLDPLSPPPACSCGFPVCGPECGSAALHAPEHALWLGAGRMSRGGLDLPLLAPVRLLTQLAADPSLAARVDRLQVKCFDDEAKIEIEPLSFFVYAGPLV